MNFRNSRSLRAAVAASSLLLLCACGSGGGGRPDLSLVEKELFENATSQTEGHARLVDLQETRCEKTEEMGIVSYWEVSVEYELEFDAPCYFHNAERAAGQRAKFEYTTNFLHDDSGKWMQEPGRIDEL